MTLLDLLDRLDRESITASRQNETWSAMCSDFLAAHDEDPEPECRIAPFFCGEIDRRQSAARDYVERREWSEDRCAFEMRLTDLILGVDPMGAIMRDAAYVPLVWRMAR